MLEAIPLVLIIAGIAAYSVLAGADFGAGVWNVLGGRRRDEIREHTHRAMAPVWEANHVWLIFVLVVCWTAYPVPFGSIMNNSRPPFVRTSCESRSPRLGRSTILPPANPSYRRTQRAESTP